MLETQKSQTFNGTIHIIPYTHMDIAWVHTRAWHVDRYVRAVDEVLDLLDARPDYRYYVDIWTELMWDYTRIRPERLDDFRRHIREGRLAVCAGHYGNVRSTNVGDETFVRNLQLGMRYWREFEPQVNLKVYADLDVTLGHTQMPQLLGLAGIKGYFAQRPLEALDAEGVPRAFYWKGLSGDTIMVCRYPYGGLFFASERHGDSWSEDWNGVVEGIQNLYLNVPEKDGVCNIALCVGSDDTRPDKLLLSNDEDAKYDELMRLWNEREPSTMQYSTPDMFFDSLEAESEKLQTLDKVLDPTDVSYNTAVKGRQGIWWLRELCDRNLVNAEIISTLAGISRGAEYPGQKLTQLWEHLLNWTPHAVQWVFRQDWNKGHLVLSETADAAMGLMDASGAALVQSCMPVDSSGLAVINTSTGRRHEVMPIWVMNTDLTRDLEGLVDANGNKIPFQVVDYPVNNAELNLLAEVDLPSCGYTTLGFEWSQIPPRSKEGPDITNADTAPYWKQKYGMSDRQTMEKETLELSSDRIRITLNSGRIVKVEDLVSGTVREAPEGSSFLEPVAYPIDRSNWQSWYAESIPDDPARFEASEVRLDEQGPLRWRATCTGKAGGFWVRQHIDLVKGESQVRSTVQILAPGEDTDGFAAIAMPIAEDATLTTDIPFGVELRDIPNIKYGFTERAIPGYFWGKTWVKAEGAGGSTALLAEDGDKFFRAHGSPKRLVHFMAQKTRIFEKGWEGYIDTFDAGGRQVFRHAMVIDPSEADLVMLAERTRRPLTYQYVPEHMVGTEAELVRVSPETVRMSALTSEDDAIDMRVVQMAGSEATVEIDLPFSPGSAEMVDFNGTSVGSVAIDGSTVKFDIRPWQVATIRLGR